MLKQATFKNFTTLPNETLVFAPGLNVIVAENGCGKTHLLKAIYSLLNVNTGSDLSKTGLQKAYADKLMGVFRPESLGRLVKRSQGRERCEVALTMADEQQSCEINFASNASSGVQVKQVPEVSLSQPPVYLPTRELVTLCPWFINLYDNYHLEFEATWRDTCSLLGAPSVKGPREKRVAQLMQPLEEAIGGKVLVEPNTGRFYLQQSGQKLEMPLVAEGLRKLAMLARLISTGVLLEQGYLFWDEPEANLNPKLIKMLAKVILALAEQGIQIFIASHSLFLLREIELLARDEYQVACRYFGLSLGEEGTVLEQADELEDIQTLVLLDEELEQADRYLGSGA
ncbi:ATP/GTP-binding protein [Aeromonas sp. QDB17]|uniref:AAA family ATPase n=1 Tax=Aeromonas sp. QDB17 TaxID=2990485 RepID=UPI0022E5EB08|nr:AAA family ATPase [Aeromonas sp. QDB17]